MNQRRKKAFSLFLSAAMVISLPLNAFASETNENENEVKPYLQPDVTPPVLHSVIIDKNKQEVRPGDIITIHLDATDDFSGIKNTMVSFWNTSGALMGIAEEGVGTNEIKIPIDKNTPTGKYVLESVSLYDNENNESGYGASGPDHLPVPGERPSFVVINEDYVIDDTKADLKSFQLETDTITIPEEGEVKLNFEMEIEAPGTQVSDVTVIFKNESNQYETISNENKLIGLHNLSNDFGFTIDQYTMPGKYILDRIKITTAYKNTVYYVAEIPNTDDDNPDTYRLFPAGIDTEFTVTNNNTEWNDRTKPQLEKIILDKTTVDVTEQAQQINITADVIEKESGLESMGVIFKNLSNNRELKTISASDNPNSVSLEISPHEGAGSFELVKVQLTDKAGNVNEYTSDNYNPGRPNRNPLPENIFFSVINNWKEPTPPTDPETPDNKPTVPNTDSDNHTGNSSSNHSGVVNYESEKPNQNDKKAVEAYNFWQNVKNKIHKAEKGKTIKVFVPKEITNMPASVMETLRRENVGMTIKQNGKTITIPAGKAQPKQKLKAYWTFKTLDRLY